MEISAQGDVTFSSEEADLIRAALFTIEHYANQVWDQVEVRAVSGFSVDEFASVRRKLDAIRLI